jgi:hypothetical protein
MSKFCIDLEGIMLPDAIAAVVEAWYDCQVLVQCRQDISNAITEKDLAIDSSIMMINNLHSFNSMKIKLERRGDKISIRGLLPSKSVKNGFAYQRIALKQPTTADGLQVAKMLADLVIDQINSGLFAWDDWSNKDFIVSTASNLASMYNLQTLTPV